MRSICIGLFFSCFVGLFVLLVHVAVGQGTRDLVDPAFGTGQTPRPPRLIPYSPPTVSPNTPSSSGPVTTGLPGSTTNVPGIAISSELSKILARDLPVGSEGASPTTTTPAESTSQAEMTRQIMSRLSSVMESETEDEWEERELLLQRQRAEKIVDPERRAAALELVEQAEINSQNRLARRVLDETGADLFYFPRLKGQYLDAGWCQLFDGYTDFGWQIQDSGHYAGGKFTFGQGEICSDPYHPGMIYTQMPFGDVTLQFDYWAEKDSEVLLLMNTPPNPVDLHSSCYTIALNSGRTTRPRGLLMGRHEYSLPQLRAMREQWDDPVSKEAGTWHSASVRIETGSIQVGVDRRTDITYFDPHPLPAGHIAFLVAKGQARFYNIMWQPKKTVVVFDSEGRDDLPWRVSDDLEFLGNNTDGFRLLGGSMESTDLFSNYVLQMQYYQGDRSGQSSLFIRGLPGQNNTGYEISLQNFPRRQDRESMAGVDAGAFRQRKDARYVRAQEYARTQNQPWTFLTVAVMDRQLQTWVNGVPVCEIADRRTTPLPPGTGPYLQPGTIRLSVPRDNTSFQFRRLTVSPAVLEDR